LSGFVRSSALCTLRLARDSDYHPRLILSDSAIAVLIQS